MVSLAPPAYYRLFGLTIESSFAFPHLPAIEGTPGSTDVRIYPGAVPEALANPAERKAFSQFRDNLWLMTAERIAHARFLVRDGREVVVETVAPDVAEPLHRFLQGSCMGMLLLQRGVLPLHGTAVATQHGAVVFAGAVGSGKSSLATALLRRGCPLLADDLVALTHANGSAPTVQPGLPYLKLWADTCHHFGIDTTGLARVRADLDKFCWRVDGLHSTEPLPLHAVFVLAPNSGDEPECRPLGGVDKVKELQAHLYKASFPQAQKHWPWLFTRLTAAAANTDVYLANRSDRESFDALSDLVTAELTP